MRLRIPTKDDFFRLTEDWPITLTDQYWLHNLLWAFYPDEDWQQREARVKAGETVTIPKGTILSIIPSRLRKMDGRNGLVTVNIVVSPHRSLSRIKFGGRVHGGASFGLPIHLLSTAEVEEVDDPRKG